MEKPHFYSLPKLSYGYKDLEPYISQEQLQIHHEKHHQAYVTGANAILERIDKTRKEKADLDMKATLKELSFHIGGHILHTLFWGNLAPGEIAPRPKRYSLRPLTRNSGAWISSKKSSPRRR